MRTLWHTGANMRSKDCADSTDQRTRDRPGTGLGVPDPDNTENDAQEQRDIDPAVETGMGSHAEESNQAQRD